MAAQLFYTPAPFAFSSNGLPAAGAKAYFYASGTLEPEDVYTTADLTTPHPNPVVANGGGRLNDVYLDDAIVYRLIIKDRQGATLLDIDPYIPGVAVPETFTQSGTGAVARTFQAKLREDVSVADYTAPVSADAVGNNVTVPTDTAVARATGAALLANYRGPKQVVTLDSNKRGKWFSNVTSAPSSLGNHDSIDTAFNGDLSRSQFQVEHRISGTDTLGTITTGYQYTPEAAAFRGYLYNTSGKNHSTSSNDGRTSANFGFINVANYGGGDCVAWTVNGVVTNDGAPVGATSWLAMPAISQLNGTLTLGDHGCYLNPIEIDLQMNGKDGGAIGPVVNITRDVGDTVDGLGACTANFRAQSLGTYPVDAAFSLSGKFKNGLDGVAGDFGVNQCLVSGEAGQRIYLNNYSTNGFFTDGFNGDYIEYSSGNSAINIVAGGTSVARFGSTLAIITQRLRLGAVLNFADDTAAAAGGLSIGDVYRTGSALKVRVA